MRHSQFSEVPLQALPRRQQEVLQATVRHYVDTMEPVGSHTLVRRFGLPASPATVRSAMGALEQKGLLTQPHASAGRVPSQLGYRHYVNCLLPAPGAAAGQLERELAGLSLQWAALDDLLLQLARRLADLTGLLSLITRPQRQQPQLQALRLVPSGDRLLVFLVESAAASSSLNLRLPAAARAELPALERWTTAQLELERNVGRIDWSTLPPQLRSSGSLLRQGLRSHRQARPLEQDGAVSLGLGGLLSLITRPQRLQPQLQALRLVPSGDRLLVFLVESAAASSSLNLRLPAASRAELPALERWTTAQLEQEGNVGRIDWSTLPPHLRSSGSLLRQGLRSHRQARPQEQDGAVSLGLGGLLSQPEFSRSESLRPLLQLVEQDPQQVLQADGAGAIGGVWIGLEHPHPALRECAVVQAPYRTGSGGLGQVALVGPMRMAYATARAAVQSVATILQQLLG